MDNILTWPEKNDQSHAGATICRLQLHDNGNSE